MRTGLSGLFSFTGLQMATLKSPFNNVRTLAGLDTWNRDADSCRQRFLIPKGNSRQPVISRRP